MPLRRVASKKAILRADLPDSFTHSLYKLAPYRGCAHACRYCDGRAEKYYVEGDFEKDIDIRADLPGLAALELPRLRERGMIAFGSGTTDPYQPCEAEEGITAKLAALLAEAKPALPALVMTKSSLALRDLSIWKKVNEKSGFVLLVSLTSLDEDLRTLMEPGASSFASRLELLARFKEAGCATGVLAMPLLPGLSDSDASIRALYTALRDTGVDFVMPGGLTLRPGRQKELYLHTLADSHPELLESTQRLYDADRPSGMPHGSALRTLNARLKTLRRDFGLPWLLPHRIYSKFLPPHDSLHILLRDMVELYADRGIDTGPLLRSADRYDSWLIGLRREFRKRRSLPSDWLEGRFDEALRLDELAQVLDNLRLSDFVQRLMAESAVFDYLELRLIPAQP